MSSAVVWQPQKIKKKVRNSRPLKIEPVSETKLLKCMADGKDRPLPLVESVLVRFVQNILIPFHYLKYKFLVRWNLRKARKYALLMYSISSINRSIALQPEVDISAFEKSLVELKKQRLKLNLAAAIAAISDESKS